MASDIVEPAKAVPPAVAAHAYMAHQVWVPRRQRIFESVDVMDTARQGPTCRRGGGGRSGSRAASTA